MLQLTVSLIMWLFKNLEVTTVYHPWSQEMVVLLEITGEGQGVLHHGPGSDQGAALSWWESSCSHWGVESWYSCVSLQADFKVINSQLYSGFVSTSQFLSAFQVLNFNLVGVSKHCPQLALEQFFFHASLVLRFYAENDESHLQRWSGCLQQALMRPSCCVTQASRQFCHSGF